MKRGSGGAGFAPSMSAQDFHVSLLQSGAARARFSVRDCWGCGQAVSFAIREVDLLRRGPALCVVCGDCSTVVHELTEAQIEAFRSSGELGRAA